MRRYVLASFWLSCVGFVVLATRTEHAAAAVCSTAGSGRVCGYGYDVTCNPLTYECKPTIYEYREFIDRPTSGPAPY